MIHLAICYQCKKNSLIRENKNPNMKIVATVSNNNRSQEKGQS